MSEVSPKPVKDKKAKKASRAATLAARERKKQQKLLEARYAEAVEQAGLKMKAGKHSEAVEHLSVAVEINPSDATSYAARAHCYTLLGEHEAAVGDYTSVLGINPQDDNAYFRRAHARTQRRVRGVPMRTEDCDFVIEDLTAAIHLNRYNFAAFTARGDALFDRRENKLAMDDYNEAININGAYGYGLIRRANCMLFVARESKAALAAAASPTTPSGAPNGTAPRRPSSTTGAVAGLRSEVALAASAQTTPDADDGAAAAAALQLLGAKGSRAAAAAALDRIGVTARAVEAAAIATDAAALRLPILTKVAYVTTAPGLADRRLLTDPTSHLPRPRDLMAKPPAEHGSGPQVRPPSPHEVEARADAIILARRKAQAVTKSFEAALDSVTKGIATYESKAKDGTLTAYAPLSAYCLKASILYELRRLDDAEAVVSLARVVCDGDEDKLSRVELLAVVESGTAARAVAAEGEG